MNKYQEITKARELLELPERATMEEIKANYRNLIRKWHPDRRKESKKRCTEMTVKIVDAYRTIIDYCNQYRYSFSEDEVRHHLSNEEWWLERFGDDPVWGGS
jgi:DnaJ-class molecular chaperone